MRAVLVALSLSMIFVGAAQADVGPPDCMGPGDDGECCRVGASYGVCRDSECADTVSIHDTETPPPECEEGNPKDGDDDDDDDDDDDAPVPPPATDAGTDATIPPAPDAAADASAPPTPTPTAYDSDEVDDGCSATGTRTSAPFYLLGALGLAAILRRRRSA